MGFPIALLFDDFTDGVIAPLWSGTAASGGASFAETGGQVRLTLAASVPTGNGAYFRTNTRYDLTGGSVYINIQTMVSTAVPAIAYMQLFDLTTGNNQLLWLQQSGTLQACSTLNGVQTTRYSVAWSATTYKYLRIREVGGSVFWDSSTNGTTWTNRASLATPFDISNFQFQIYANCGNVAAPGSFRVDDVNLPLPAPSSTWRETVGDWQNRNRMRSITLASDGGKQGVIATAESMDSARVLGGTVRYFAGPLGSTSGGYMQLTEYASLALAQASAFPIPVNSRIDLPAQVDARYMRLYHRSIDGLAHVIYEYMPRRLVQADDIEAESIAAINISAGAVTADKIDVLDLSAITATIGQLTIASAQGLPAWIYQGTGTGDSPTTGLKIFNSGGIGKLSTYNTAVEQVTLDTDGRMKWGAGAGRADASGISIINAAGFDTQRAYAFRDSTAAAIVGGLYSLGNLNTPIYVKLEADGSGNSSNGVGIVQIQSVAAASLQSMVQLRATRGATTYSLELDIGVNNAIGFFGANVNINNSLGVGFPAQTNIRLLARGQDATASNYALLVQNSSPANLFFVRNDGYCWAGQQEIPFIGSGIAPQSNVRVFIRGTDSTSANYGIYIDNSGAAGSSFYVRNDGLVSVAKAGAPLGFYGSTGAGRPTITGAKGGNVALANLLASLAGLNLLVDSTT